MVRAKDLPDIKACFSSANIRCSDDSFAEGFVPRCTEIGFKKQTAPIPVAVAPRPAPVAPQAQAKLVPIIPDGWGPPLPVLGIPMYPSDEVADAKLEAAESYDPEHPVLPPKCAKVLKVKREIFFEAAQNATSARGRSSEPEVLDDVEDADSDVKGAKGTDPAATEPKAQPVSLFPKGQRPVELPRNTRH